MRIIQSGYAVARSPVVESCLLEIWWNEQVKYNDWNAFIFQSNTAPSQGRRTGFPKPVVTDAEFPYAREFDENQEIVPLSDLSGIGHRIYTHQKRVALTSMRIRPCS